MPGEQVDCESSPHGQNRLNFGVCVREKNPLESRRLKAPKRRTGDLSKLEGQVLREKRQRWRGTVY